MFSFQKFVDVPKCGGRSRGTGNPSYGTDILSWYGCGGGLVELEGRIMWGVGGGEVYVLNELRNEWVRNYIGCGECGARLVVYGGKLVFVGGSILNSKNVTVMTEDGRWSSMPDMVVGSRQSCVLSIGTGFMVVIGGNGDWNKHLSDVQVFDGKDWHLGPPVPQPCESMSAAVHGECVFMTGGWGMEKAVWCTNICELTALNTENKKQWQSVWRKLPDVPYYYSSICVVDGMMLAIGGAEDKLGTMKTSAICAFDNVCSKWKHIGDMPFKCSWIDALLLSDGKLLVVDGESRQVSKVTGKGLATLYPNIPNPKCADERALYIDAMTKGYIKTSVTKVLILGAAGVGKTHLKHLLLNKDPPEQRVSTGLADNSVRAISFSLAGVGDTEDNWFLVEDDKALMHIVGEAIKGGDVTMAPSLNDVVSGLPKMAISVPSGFGQFDQVHEPIAVKVTTQQSKSAALEDELIYYINHSSVKKKLCGVNWIQFIDSGGQLQYHDILPFFVQNSDVCIFVLKLSEELSHHPTIEYYKDSEPVCTPYPSYLSHKQILQQCLGAIGLKGAHHLVITVGTHRDTLNECTESIDEKNDELQEIIKATGCCGLCDGENLNMMIFAVNAKAPLNEDRRVAKELRNRIMSMSPKSIEMPIAWFGLEVLLQRSSDDGILSLSKCQECAKTLFIEGDVFSAALHYLVQHNVFLYYPEVLPQTVFCNPQVVLTKVTEVVQYHHKLKYNPDQKVAADRDLIKFRDEGVLSVKLLKRFQNNYKEGLFYPQDLLNLLERAYVIARIRDGEYLMPALLPNLDATQISNYHHGALMIRSTSGYNPSGLFCYLVVHLQSSTLPSPWMVCRNGDKAICLHRNCISFTQRGTHAIVTLFDMFSHIGVHIKKAASQECRKIRNCIHSGIKSACSVLKVSNVKFEDAFMCAGVDCISYPPHVAVVEEEGSIDHIQRCTMINYQTDRLTVEQLMWFIESTVPKQDPTTELPTLREVEKELAPVIEWKLVGQNLNVPDEVLANVESDTRLPDMKSRKRAMLKWWLDNETQASWRKLAQALENIHGKLAESILSKYC